MKRSAIQRKGRVKPVSDKRRGQAKEREQCRETVLSRDLTCRGCDVAPVSCTRIPTEVHELGRGSYRSSCWLNPELCLGMCRHCHQWVTEHPREAQLLGLAWPGWRVQQFLDTQ